MVRDDLRALFRQTWPYRWALALASVLMMVQSLTSLTVPWLAGQVTASLIDSESGGVLPMNLMFAAMIGLLTVQAGLTVAQGYLLTSTANHAVADLRVRLYDHLQSLPLGFYHDRSRGDLLALLTRDVDVLGGFISGTLVSIAPSLLTLLGAFIMMVRIDWPLSCAVVLAVPAFFLVVLLIGRHIRPLSDELAAAHAKAVAVAEENLSLLPIIKAFTREADTSAHYEQQTKWVHALTTRHQFRLLRLGPAIELAATAGFVVLLWLATRNVMVGTLSPADLVAFLMYGLLLTRPLGRLASVYGETQHARSIMTRLLTVRRVAPEAVIGSGRQLPRVKGAIEFQNVFFAYPGRRPTFEGLNLRVSPGETVAITGPNGTGKSTLINLLLRFLVPDGGRILIDGVDISTVSLPSLRAQIGLVPQCLLFHSGSVRDNIAVGRPGATENAIEAAAHAARAHDFITKLPDGYDTIVGEKGGKLSGGQQQRIALARALLKNPPILILDEATAMFDPVGEEEFLALSNHMLRDRAVLLITHRPAGLKLADRILRLDARSLCQVGAS